MSSIRFHQEPRVARSPGTARRARKGTKQIKFELTIREGFSSREPSWREREKRNSRPGAELDGDFLMFLSVSPAPQRRNNPEKLALAVHSYSSCSAPIDNVSPRALPCPAH